jgi:hypothetical protein
MNASILSTLLAMPADPGAEPLSWHDAKGLTVEGRGWPQEAPGFYDRLPARAQSVVHELDWRFSQHSAGIVVRFTTDARDLYARWNLKLADVAMMHMPATGVSGLDLYVRHHGAWEWLSALPCGTVMKGGPNESKLVLGLPAGDKELCLYLPPYNGVTSVEIGIPQSASIRKAPPRTRDIKPLVIYGTSIPQGGCACRPGMSYPCIVGRRLDAPIINLGFSGSGRCEPGMVDLLAELDPSVFIVDSIVNMETPIVEERMRNLLTVLNRARPRTPLILMEEAVPPGIFTRERTLQTAKSAILQKVIEEKAPEWGNRLYLVKGDMLLGDDGLGTVDGIHPTDVGFLRMADVLTPVVSRVLAAHEGGR